MDKSGYVGISVDSPDLSTHLLFSGDTRILQGSPAHPRRIANHPHLAAAARLGIRALFSADPVSHWIMKMRLYRTAETFEGENLRELMKNTILVEKTLTDCWLLPRQECHAPKFRGENHRESPQNRKVRQN